MFPHDRGAQRPRIRLFIIEKLAALSESFSRYYEHLFCPFLPGLLFWPSFYRTMIPKFTPYGKDTSTNRLGQALTFTRIFQRLLPPGGACLPCPAQAGK